MFDAYANEHAERLLVAKRIFGIGEQDNSLVDSVECPFITTAVNLRGVCQNAHKSGAIIVQLAN